MGQVEILAIISLKREKSPQAHSRPTVKRKSNSGTENLKREAAEKERGSRSERIRYRQIEPGGITKLEEVLQSRRQLGVKKAELPVAIPKAGTKVIQSNGKEGNLEKNCLAENKIRWRLIKGCSTKNSRNGWKNLKRLTVIESEISNRPPGRCSKVHCTKKERLSMKRQIIEGNHSGNVQKVCTKLEVGGRGPWEMRKRLLRLLKILNRKIAEVIA